MFLFKLVQVHNLLSEILKTENFSMEVDSNLNTTVTMTTMTTLLYPLLQDPQARCNVPLLRVYVQGYSSVWACLCLKFYWMFYWEIKSTLVILWSIFIPLKINNAMNNIYQLVLITCAILPLSSWPLIALTTIAKSEKFRFPKRAWSRGFRVRDCVPVLALLPVLLRQRERETGKSASGTEYSIRPKWFCIPNVSGQQL
jgi:hypothetical protein